MPLTKIAIPDEVLGHWGLARDPFSQEIQDFADILELSPFRKAERKVLRAADSGGWVAITGPIGSGKTTLVKKVRARLLARHDVYLIEPSPVEAPYLRTSTICDAMLFALVPDESLPNGLPRKVQKIIRLVRTAAEDRKHIVLLIDEAHLLQMEALLALKRFHEIDAKFDKLLSIVLVGQPALDRHLRMNLAVTEVGQRVDLFGLGAMNGATGEYLAHKLTRAGLPNGKEVFERKAIRAIGQRAETPLSINNLAAASLVAAWELQEATVTAEMVNAVHGGV